MFSEREGERETENDNVIKRRELQRTHTRARTRACPRPRRTASWTLPQKQKPRRGGRAAAQRPVRKSAAGRGGEAAPSFGGPRINIVRAREKVKATRKCRGEERESSELNLIFFSARGKTEVSLSPGDRLNFPQRSAAPSQGRSL